MSATLLEIIKQFCARRSLPIPPLVMGSQDDQLLQLVGLLNEVLEDLTTRYVGEALQKQTVWLQTGTESQGKLTDLCPFGFKWIVNGTFWDRSRQLPVRGPLSAQEWADMKGRQSLGAWLQYRVMGGELLLLGELSAGPELALEYASDWAVRAADEVTWKSYFSVDTDTSSFPTSVLLAGLNWRWRLEKGFKYAEAFREYETKVAEFNGHDGSKPVLRMDGGCYSAQPIIFMPTNLGPR